MQELREIVGDAHVWDVAGAVSVYPANTEELAAVLRVCSGQGLKVSAMGGGTKSSWGNHVNPDVRVHTKRIAGVLEHSWGDLTATIAAGTTWAAMETEIARNGQRVALDPMVPQMATVGGVLATNDSGLLRLKYGSLRDLILGMTVVLADGTIARAGGKVVKNVAGYDIPKLMTGSFGTLGIITEATFRLHPVAKNISRWTLRCADVVPLAELMTRILKAGLSVERMQLRTETVNFSLDLELASLPEALAEHEGILKKFAADSCWETADEEVFEAREDLFREFSTVLKITAQTTKLAALAAGFAELAQMPERKAGCVADPVGIVTAGMTGPDEWLAMIVEDLRARLSGTGGTVVVLQSGGLPLGFDMWGPAPGAIDVMRAIKAEFDAGRVLNPGKFVGRL